MADVDPDWSDRIGIAILVVAAILLAVLLGVGALWWIQYLIDNP